MAPRSRAFLRVTLDGQQESFSGLSSRHAIVYDKDALHGLAVAHAVAGCIGHRDTVVGPQHAVLGGGPGQDALVSGSGQTDILNAGGVEFRHTAS